MKPTTVAVTARTPTQDAHPGLRAALDAFFLQLAATEQAAHIEYFKMGTEEEGLDFGEIFFVREILPTGTNIVVKIGGPCARADIRQAREVGACGLVAPMVESTYGLFRYVEAVEQIFGAGRPLRIGINLETVTAWRKLPDLLATPAAKRLTFMNIGRSDLAASLGHRVTDEATHDAVCDIVRQVLAFGLPVMVGGNVTVGSLRPLVERVQLTGFQTRCLAFALNADTDLDEVVHHALRLEIALMRVLAARFPDRAAEHLGRLHVATARLEA
jgi:hypothetical protein